MLARRWLLAIALLNPITSHVQAQPGAKPATVLENDYVLVSRNIAPCAIVSEGKCEDRVILAMGDLMLASGGKKRQLKRAEVAVFDAKQSYEVAVGSPFFEIAILHFCYVPLRRPTLQSTHTPASRRWRECGWRIGADIACGHCSR